MRRRLAALLVCCAAAAAPAAAVGAPAPLPPRERVGPWLSGWDRPGPAGEWRIERRAGKLSLTVFAREPHRKVLPEQVIPQLLRGAEGDFAIAVRVSAATWLPERPGQFEAGLVLLGGHGPLYFYVAGTRQRRGEGTDWQSVRASYLKTVAANSWPALESTIQRAVWLRLERREKEVRLSYGSDGEQWSRMTRLTEGDFPLPARTKVGVFAASTGAAFQVHFDRLSLGRGEW
jgi:hypothetical protein